LNSLLKQLGLRQIEVSPLEIFVTIFFFSKQNFLRRLGVEHLTNFRRAQLLILVELVHAAAKGFNALSCRVVTALEISSEGCLLGLVEGMLVFVQERF